MKIQTVEVTQGEQAIHESLTAEEVTPLIITKAGKAIAALVPLLGADLESAKLALDKRFIEIIEEGRRQLRDEDSIPLEAMEQRFR